jgi:hypothetical protein
MTFQASLESLPIIHIPEPAKFFRRSTRPKEREWSRQQPAGSRGAAEQQKMARPSSFSKSFQRPKIQQVLSKSRDVLP